MSGSLCISIFICRAILPVQFHALFSQLSPRLGLCSRSRQDTAAPPHSLYLSPSSFPLRRCSDTRHSGILARARRMRMSPGQTGADSPLQSRHCPTSFPVFCPLNVFCNFQNFCSLFEPLSPCFAHGVSGFGQLPFQPCWQWWVCHHCLSPLPSSVSSLHFAPLLPGQFSLPRLHFWPPSVIWSLQQPGPVGVFQ